MIKRMNHLAKHHQRCTYFGKVITHDYFQKNKVDDSFWYDLCRYGTLTEDFVREFVNEINWEDFNEFIVLEDDMIREFKDYINLGNYFRFGWLSTEMIRELKDELPFEEMKRWYLAHLNEKVKKEFLDESFMYK